jgi:8-oxo-dGTP pyrophosphatase MutT (NUDIX family)
VIYDGKLLMGKRRDNGRWTCPGGHLNEGEEPLAGGVRELYEESGIAAPARELKQIGFNKVTKPDGGKLEVTAYKYEPKARPSTSMRADPDLEVHRWRWIDVSRGTLPPHIADHLHVPLDRNVLLKGLGIKAMEKTAFWNGFDKQAMVPSLNPLGALAAGAKSLVGKAVASPLAGKAMNAGVRAAEVAKAHPKTALGLGAAGAAGVGYMAGRPSAPAGPRYPY